MWPWRGGGRDNLNLLWVKNEDGEAVCSQRAGSVGVKALFA